MNPSDLNSEFGLRSWHFKCDNPTFLGWSVVTVYALAAVSCVAAARLSRATDIGTSTDRPKGASEIWWVLAFGLAFLGINKQLNLQTLLIDLVRHLSFERGWWGRRREAQLVFSGAFGIATGVVLMLAAARYREFFKNNPCPFWGLIIFCLFVGLRAATINHADEYLRIDLKDGNWAWVLEIAGSLLIGIGALQQAGSRSHR